MAKQLTPKQAKALSLHEDALKLLQEDKAEDALPLLKEAALIAPTSQNIAANLGFAHLALDENEEALACFKRAVALKPNWSLGHYNMGLALYKLRRVSEAREAYEKALRYTPDDLAASNNLALCLLETLEIQPALDLLQDILDRDPDNVDATLNMAKLWSMLDRPKPAIGLLKRLADKVHDDAELLVDLGAALRRTGDYKFAAEVLERALKIDPSDTATTLQLAMVLMAWRQYKKSIELLEALDEDPEFEAQISQLLGVNYNSIGELETGLEYGLKAVELQPNNFSFYLNPIFSLNYWVPPSPERIFELTKKFDEQAAQDFNKIPRYEEPPAKPKSEKLRLAFLSPDYREHSCSYFVEGLFRNLDRERFEVVGVPLKATSDSRTMILKQITDDWLPIYHLELGQQLEILRDRKIDIAFDLAGHTSDNLLIAFAQRFAPVQVNWLGYPNTTGVKAMDYRFIDDITDPEDADRQYYSEKLVRLPECFLNYSPPQATPIILDKSPNDHIVFVSFNSVAKVNKVVVAAWIEILKRVPGSRILMKALQLDDDDLVKQIFDSLTEQGVDRDRLEVLGPMPSTFDHLNTYNEADIGLDTFPYNGTTTTCEAAWMGVPVITTIGEVHSARVGASLNTALGLEELIAKDPEEYVEKAVALATDVPRLRALQNGLRGRMENSVLRNDALYAERFGAAIEQIWEQHLAKNEGLVSSV